MKHKHLKHLFTALLLLCASVVMAHDFEVGGIYYNITDAANRTVEVTYKGNDSSDYSNEYTGSVTIPQNVTYNGTTYCVTSIGWSSFNRCTDLINVEIPNSVTSIGVYAFYCSGITSVVIPDGVTSIEDEVFLGCSNLASIEIPNSVESIGWSALYGCSSLTSIKIPSSVTSISEFAFWGCSALKKVHIDDLAAWCGIYFEDALSNPLCYAGKLYLNNELITELSIPNNVTSIRSYTFSGCTGLVSIEIPNSVESIGEDAFYNCTGLTSVEIPQSVTSIGRGAFSCCTGLTDVEIPASVTSIGGGAFSGCSGLVSVEFNAENCTSTGVSYYTVFSGCTALSTVTIGENVKNIPDCVFSSCTGLTSVVIPNSVTSIGRYTFSNCTGLTSIEIPNSVTSVGVSAFEGCINIENLYISSSLESIGENAFAGCEKITDIKIGLEKPIRGIANIFADAVYDNATLYVPIGAKSFYEKREPWNLFFYIVEMDFTGIDEVLSAETGDAKTIYDLQGRAIETPTDGIFIVGGKKVLVR